MYKLGAKFFEDQLRRTKENVEKKKSRLIFRWMNFSLVTYRKFKWFFDKKEKTFGMAFIAIKID